MRHPAIALKRDKKPLVLCAGQKCPQRSECLRFQMRGGYMPYASYDIEREKFKGDCPVLERIR